MPMTTEYVGNTVTVHRTIPQQDDLVSRHNTYIVDGLSDDEPIFAIRGNDATAIAALNFYLLMQDGAISDDKSRGLEEIRDRFIHYQRAHPERVHLPD